METQQKHRYTSPRVRVVSLADYTPILQSSTGGDNESPTPGIGIGDDE